MLSLSCITASSNRLGAKSCQSGAPFQGKFCSAVSKNSRNKAGFSFGTLEENGPRSKALIKSILLQIGQLSGFWFQGIPTYRFQKGARWGFLGTVGSCILSWSQDVGDAQAMCPRPSEYAPSALTGGLSPPNLLPDQTGTSGDPVMATDSCVRAKGGTLQWMAHIQKNYGNATTLPHRTAADL